MDPNVVTSLLRGLGELGDESIVRVLLDWAKRGDDFHRLDAFASMTKLGDERAIPVARALLTEERKPERRESSGFMCQSSVFTIAQLARDELAKSPNDRLRALAQAT